LSNQGTQELLHGMPLPAALRLKMERSLGVSLQAVRVRQDPAAQEQARELDAEAFARGDEILLGSGAPMPDSPEAEGLLAHEAAHIVQQRRASRVEDAIGAPGDRHEQAADQASVRMLAGAHAEPAAGGSVPAVQREPIGKEQSMAGRAEVERALHSFLQRVLARMPGTDLRTSRVVRNALDTLVLGGGSSAIFVSVDDFLKQVPNEPAEFARRFAQKLPRNISRAAIERLDSLATADSPPGLATRAADLVKRSAAGKPERTEEPGRVSPEKSAEQAAQTVRQLRGEGEPSVIGPGSIDVLQAARILRGAPGVFRPPQPRTVQPAARGSAELDAAIQAIPEDALVPAEFRGGPRAGDFADARGFARDVARQLDIAQQQRRDTISINLGDAYNSVRDRQAIRAAIENIIERVRAALPHRGSEVTNVDIYFGRTLITRGRARAAE
jgi:hypothetical protein